MWPALQKIRYLWLFLPCLLLGCEKDDEFIHNESAAITDTFPIQTGKGFSYLNINKNLPSKSFRPTGSRVIHDYSAVHLLNRAVIPSECGATEFSRILFEHFTELAADPLATEYLNFYTYLNYNAALLGIGTETFGEDGEYTQLVNRIERDLERFWNMEDEISIRGQHTSTLNDPEMLTEILWYLIADLDSKEQLQPEVERILQLNLESPLLPESPFFASDVFSRFNNMIVLGDGLIEMFSETGISGEVAWTGILAHEWAHQIQFDYFFYWYPFGSFESPAEQTRQIELEADFFSAYYLTHKRGATYNWKKAQEFFVLFFQAGDCSFEFELHHGTPLQRMQAAKEGYKLAQSAQKKGHILTSEEVHEYFINIALPEIIPENYSL